MDEKKICMISQPMRGLSDDQILAQRKKAIETIESQGYQFLSTFFTEDDPRAKVPHDVKCVPLCYLANCLKEMAKCDAVYFCEGWQEARGCRVEHECAEAYGLTVIEEM